MRYLKIVKKIYHFELRTDDIVVTWMRVKTLLF